MILRRLTVRKVGSDFVGGRVSFCVNGMLSRLRRYFHIPLSVKVFYFTLHDKPHEERLECMVGGSSCVNGLFVRTGDVEEYFIGHFRRIEEALAGLKEQTVYLQVEYET